MCDPYAEWTQARLMEWLNTIFGKMTHVHMHRRGRPLRKPELEQWLVFQVQTFCLNMCEVLLIYFIPILIFKFFCDCSKHEWKDNANDLCDDISLTIKTGNLFSTLYFSTRTLTMWHFVGKSKKYVFVKWCIWFFCFLERDSRTKEWK